MFRPGSSRVRQNAGGDAARVLANAATVAVDPPRGEPLSPRDGVSSIKGNQRSCTESRRRPLMAVTELHVNGTKRRVDTDAERSLLSVLRDDLDLTGSKYGCGEGRCGACTVLLDGKAVRSCVTSVGDCASKPITTIEGLEQGGKLHPLQAAFLEVGAMQCGYCTCGMILA